MKMSESEMVKNVDTRHKAGVSVPRFALTVLVPAVYSVVVGYFVPDTIGPGRPVIPLLVSLFAMIALTNLNDARRKGKISLAQQKKKSLVLIVLVIVYQVVFLAPAFFWPEHFLKIFIAMNGTAILAGSVQSLVQWRKKRKAQVAAEAEKVNTQEDL